MDPSGGGKGILGEKTPALLSGLLIALATSSGIFGERVTSGSTTLAFLSNCAVTLAAIVACAHLRARLSCERRVALEAIGVVLGIASIHAAMWPSALLTMSGLTESPFQLVNDLVAAFAVLGAVHACAGRRFRTAPLAVAGVAVVSYLMTSAHWHVDHVRFTGITVQHFVVFEVLGVSLALLVFRVFRAPAGGASREMISHVEMITRIAVSAALGGVIGFERDRHGRPVGLRTHLIVAMTAATFMVVSSQFVYFQHYGGSDLVEVDSSRIAASVVSGIGFLAGGAILRTGITIQGLTTAAGLWLVTAIGLCGGSGMYFEGIAVTGMGIGALTVLRRFEDKNISRRRVSIVIEGAAGEEVSELAPIIASLRELSIAVSDLAYESEQLGNGGERVTATLAIETTGAVTVEKMIAKLRTSPGVRRVRVESP